MIRRIVLLLLCTTAVIFATGLVTTKAIDAGQGTPCTLAFIALVTLAVREVFVPYLKKLKEEKRNAKR